METFRALPDERPQPPQSSRLKLPLACYRLGDSATEGACIASIDSSDWKLREIGRQATETIMELFEQYLRRPMLEESAFVVANKPRGVPLISQRFDAELLPPSEQERFRKLNLVDCKSHKLFLVLRPPKLQDIIRETFPLVNRGIPEEPGIIFASDLHARIMNLFNTHFASERACIETLVGQGKDPTPH